MRESNQLLNLNLRQNIYMPPKSAASKKKPEQVEVKEEKPPELPKPKEFTDIAFVEQCLQTFSSYEDLIK